MSVTARTSEYLRRLCLIDENKERCIKLMKDKKQVGRYFVFIFSVVLMVIGVLLIVGGAMLTQMVLKYDIILEKAPFRIAVFTIIVGAIIVITGCVGWWGATTQNYWFIYVFSILVFVVLLLQFVDIITVLSIKSKAKEMEIKDVLKDSVGEYYLNRRIQNAWDFMQQDLKCCGVNNYTDWENDIPDSCYVKIIRVKEDKRGSGLFKDGCWMKLIDLLHDQILDIGVSDILFILALVIGIGCSCYLANILKKEAVGNGQQGEEADEQGEEKGGRKRWNPFSFRWS